MSLEKLIEEFLLSKGALKVRFANRESLAGGPPSTDLTYQLEGARSAVSFALPLDRAKIRPYLSKEDRRGYDEEQIAKSVLSSKISKECAHLISQEGHAAARVHGNNKYRTEIDGWQLKMNPDISHRYVAVASGLGSFGWSGNVGMKGHGAAIILGTVVTTADLAPTDPLSEAESFCDKCKLCAASCVGNMFSKDEETSVTLGGRTFKFAKRIDCTRCMFVCGGFTGLHSSGKWSTWSPGRYAIPEKAEDTLNTMFRAIANYNQWPQTQTPGDYANQALSGVNIRLTCGNCCYLCWGDKEQTRENYRLLTSSGCVIQRESGEKVVLPPDQARAEFEALPPAHRRLYG
jgi:epoxyqueuosine reductase